MITIQEILQNRGINWWDSKVKLVRHKDSHKDLFALYSSDKEKFWEYQETQVKEVFRGADYIVSFIGEAGLTSRFVGVFKVGDALPVTYNGVPYYRYQLTKMPGFEDLEERIIIRWENAISWHQWWNNRMEVVEISAGLHYRHFTDYLDFSLSFPELKNIVNESYSDWRVALSVVKGVYVIADELTGKLYIGSAYGTDGIWGRWSDYVATDGHGNNKSLIELVNSDALYAYKHFRFSVLHILPMIATDNDVVRMESIFKQKLGTICFGLNNN